MLDMLCDDRNVVPSARMDDFRLKKLVSLLEYRFWNVKYGSSFGLYTHFVTCKEITQFWARVH